MNTTTQTHHCEPWNKGKLVGQKSPLRLKDIWAIRVRLQLGTQLRDLALFNLAADSKPRACDLVKLKVRDTCHGDRIASRTTVMQQKTQHPVQFEITEPTQDTVSKWIQAASLRSEDFYFQASYMILRIYPLENMRALYMARSATLA